MGLARKKISLFTIPARIIAAIAFSQPAGADPLPAIRPVPVQILRDAPALVEIALPEAAAGARILLADNSVPLGWAMAVQSPANSARFASDASLSGDTRDRLRAWIVNSRYFNELQIVNSLDTGLWATVDSVGPGGATAWLSIGSDFGVAVGDRFWLRERGQPLSRLDVRLVDANLCHCRVLRLATGAQLSTGNRVASWTGLGSRRNERSTSAVCFAEGTADAPLIWVAAPPPVPTPDEPRVDFYREARYVGFGIVERRDARFWYVRPLASACLESIRVGDDAIVRTLADVRAQSYSARVFAQTSEGSLITAGEPDGVRVGQVGLLVRGGVPVGRVEVKRAHGGYATCVRMTEHKEVGPSTLVAEVENDRGATIAMLDEVRFGPIRDVCETMGIVTVVVGVDLFAAELGVGENLPCPRTLGVRQNGRVVGMAVLVSAEGGRGIGFVVPETMGVPLAPGAELVTNAAR